MNRGNDVQARTGRILQILAGYTFLLGCCYLLSARVLLGGATRFMVLILAVPGLYLLYRKPILLIAVVFFVYNSVLERKFFPIHLLGQADILSTEVILIVGYLAVFKDHRGKLYDLFLGSRVRRSLLRFLLVYSICAVWSALFLNAHFFGNWGLFVFIRDFVLYFYLFVFLAQIDSEETLFGLLKFLLAVAVVGGSIHMVLFFQRGQGILGELFPAFLWHARPLTSGTYYGTETGFLRLFNPGIPLTRVLLTVCFSFYLHTRNRRWLYFVFFFTTSVIIQFTRMTWVSFMAILPLFFVIMERDRLISRIRESARRFSWTKFLFAASAFVLAFYLLGNVMKIPAAQFVMERFLSIGKGAEEASVAGRLFSFTYIWENVSSSPLRLLLGNGIFFMTADSSYFGLLGGMGILGLGFYAWLFFQYFKQGLGIYYRLQKTSLKALCLGAILSFLQVMINGVSGNYIGTSLWMPSLCFLFAVPELCLRFDRGSKSFRIPLPEEDR